MRKLIFLLCIFTVMIAGCGYQAVQMEETVFEFTPDILMAEAAAAAVSETTVNRPFAIVIANNKAALPQYGISKANVYYEAPVEGNMTRLLVFVQDYNDLAHIGPVRSARDYFVYEAMGKNAIFCHWGLAVPYCADLINGSSVDNVSAVVSGIDKGSNEAFKRISRKGKALEFTGYMDIAGYKKAIGRHNYSNSAGNSQFTFDAGKSEYANAAAATKIYPGGTGSSAGGYGNAKPGFEYNAADKLYYRSQYGQKHIDEMTKQQLTVSNVVFQYMSGEARDANGYLRFDVIGSGKAKLFTNGKMIDGTWKRDSESKPAKFYDEAGNEMILSPGKTWICAIWDKHGDKVKVE
ncbi:MAG: DUF3048 domain-containing protein [Lachnospiraceae bacterium]|nr:DUF3048 domain-containing protein [Lachnospiraceae bacterium]